MNSARTVSSIKGISSSTYSMSISCINETRKPLANHICQRILEAQKQNFANEKLAETIALRCDLAQQLKSLQSKHPHIDINNYQPIMEQSFMLPECKKLNDTDDKIIFSLKKVITYIANDEKRLD